MNRIRLLLFMLICIMLIGLLISCGKKELSEPFIGEWSRVEKVTGIEEMYESGFIFRANGEYESYRKSFDEKGNAYAENRTYGTWKIEEDGNLIVSVKDTERDIIGDAKEAISDYHEGYSESILKRDKEYTKTRRKDICAKNRDSVQCYYVENDTLYIDGVAYGDKVIKEKQTTDSATVVSEGCKFIFDLNFLGLSTSGRYQLWDGMDRKLFTLCERGTYELYENKLILCADYNRMEMQFYKDGDQWIYDAESSYGPQRISDTVFWEPYTEEGFDHLCE